jgi:DNA-binding MarR family transcriptional regulator
MIPPIRSTEPSGRSRPGRRAPASGRHSAEHDAIARVIDSWSEVRPELDVEPIAILGRLARATAAVGPRIDVVLGRFGLRAADFSVLATLVRLAGERVAQKRLAQELGLSPGTISVRVDRLAARGLVRREGDPADGRGALVTLTDRGRQLFERCAPEHLANARALVSGLTGPERDQLARLLGRLLASLEEPSVLKSPAATRT